MVIIPHPERSGKEANILALAFLRNKMRAILVELGEHLEFIMMDPEDGAICCLTSESFSLLMVKHCLAER